MDLSGNNLHVHSLEFLSQALQWRLRFIKTLNLFDVSIPRVGWELLCPGFQDHPSLMVLNLSKTNLGRGSQDPIAAIASALATSRVKTLNLSSNFIQHEGARALGEMLETLGTSEGRLGQLDVSNNAGGFNLTRGDGLSYNPMLLLFERLTRSNLKTLLCASCVLGREADLVLENALSGHPTLCELDLSDNPHGTEGLRCLLRLSARKTSNISLVHLGGLREGVDNEGFLAKNASCCRTDGTPAYDYANPEQKYELDLRHPAHRAILNLLFERAKEEKQIASAFVDVLWNRKPVKSIQALLKNSETLEVPTTGSLSFTFQLDLSMIDADTSTAVRQHFRQRKIPLTFVRFVAVLYMYESLVYDHLRRMLVQAISLDLLLKLSHLKQFTKRSPKFAAEIVTTLLPAVELSQQCHHVLFDLANRHDQQEAIRIATKQFAWFNEKHSDGHYQLELGNKCDRGVAERILVVNSW